MVADGYKQTEIGVIPEDWGIKVLSKSFKFKNGLNKAKEFFGHGTPIVNYMDVYNNYGLRKDDIIGKVDVTGEEQRNYHVEKGDVFFTRTSETVDEIGLSTVVVDDIVNTVFSGFILRARPIDDMYNLEFKKYCFSSRVIRRQIMATSSYTTRALTNGTLLGKILVPIPPKQEQKAIATALSDTDGLIDALEKLIAKKEDIKTGTMQELLTGNKRLDGFSGEWVEKRLGDISSINQGLQISISKRLKYPTHNSKVYITIQYLNDGKNIEYIDLYTKSVVCDEDDILMTRTGNTGEVISNVSGVFHNNFFKINYDRLIIDKRYLVYYLTFESTQKIILAKAGTSTIPDLNHKDFYSIGIKMPRLEEQKAIATILSDMDKEIETLKNKLTKIKAIKEGMMQELLSGKTRLLGGEDE